MALLICVAMMTGIVNREQEIAAARMREEMMAVAGRARSKTNALSRI
ncbi:hypothetical protein LJC32_02600 [Oscillospiraceae bacterium OttesenSCG-928-F05]|nr:hypothetical protein [Oscillospiraceae bacterium OttesenSCG-928-F05]